MTRIGPHAVRHNATWERKVVGDMLFSSMGLSIRIVASSLRFSGKMPPVSFGTTQDDNNETHQDFQRIVILSKLGEEMQGCAHVV